MEHKQKLLRKNGKWNVLKSLQLPASKWTQATPLEESCVFILLLVLRIWGGSVRTESTSIPVALSSEHTFLGFMSVPHPGHAAVIRRGNRGSAG